MSRENVEVVRAIYEAWERGDYTSTEWADPQIEFVIAGGPSPGRWKGLTEMAQGEREFLSAWEDYRLRADEFRDLDDERVLVLIHHRGRGKTSDMELTDMQATGGTLFHLRDGRVTRLVLYWDRERALEAVNVMKKGPPR